MTFEQTTDTSINLRHSYLKDYSKSTNQRQLTPRKTDNRISKKLDLYIYAHKHTNSGGIANFYKIF